MSMSALLCTHVQIAAGDCKRTTLLFWPLLWLLVHMMHVFDGVDCVSPHPIGPNYAFLFLAMLFMVRCHGSWKISHCFVLSLRSLPVRLHIANAANDVRA